jgi:hypothetical protein
MTRGEPSTVLARPALKRGTTHDERQSCLACGAWIGIGEPTIKIRQPLVHMRCAVYRRRGDR